MSVRFVFAICGTKDFDDAAWCFHVVVCQRLEGDRILANLEMHETDVSSNAADDSLSGLPQVGSVVTAR